MIVIIIIVAILVLFLFIKGVQTEYKNRYIKTPTHKPAVRDIAKEQRTLRVNIDKFIKEYGKGCSIPRDLQIEMIKAIAKGEKYYSITEEEYRTTLENYDKHNKKEQTLALSMKESTDTACYNIEAPNRFRIFNDSIELIASTPKTSTFILRVGDIENFFVWVEEQTAKGIQIELGKDIAELQKEIYERINVNAIRIAEKEYTKWLSVDRTSEKKIDNATAKAFEALDELAKCIKTSVNGKETLEQIEHFRTTIEQIYSEL